MTQDILVKKHWEEQLVALSAQQASLEEKLADSKKEQYRLVVGIARENGVEKKVIHSHQLGLEANEDGDMVIRFHAQPKPTTPDASPAEPESAPEKTPADFSHVKV